MNIDEQAILISYLMIDYRLVTGLNVVNNPNMRRVQIEHPQPGVSHPEAYVNVPYQQFIDNFNIYVSGRLPE